MATSTRLAPNGRGEADIIANFADGLSYSRNKMEEALTSGILEKSNAPATKEVFKCKKDDVDLIVSELEITRNQAERALAEHGQDVLKALSTLIAKPP